MAALGVGDAFVDVGSKNGLDFAVDFQFEDDGAGGMLIRGGRGEEGKKREELQGRNVATIPPLRGRRSKTERRKKPAASVGMTARRERRGTTFGDRQTLVRTSVGFGALQVLEQLFGFGVVGRKLQGALYFGAGQIRFLLLEVDAGEQGANDGGITRLQRGLEFADGVIEFAAAAMDFGEAAMSSGIGRLGAKNNTEFGFGGIQMTGDEFLARATNVRSQSSQGSGACGGISHAGRRGNFQTQGGGIQLHAHAGEARD